MVLQNFIVFEGIDGAGTSTQINILKNNPEAKKFLFTAEPTPAPTGIFLRSMLKGSIKISNETAAYLFAADRNEHVNGAMCLDGSNLATGIRKACADGYTVVSDRYLFSSLAYQSIDCPPELPRMLNSLFPLPELLFYFDIKPADSLRRVDSRGEREIYEKLDFLERTEAQYRKIIAEYNGTELGAGMKTITLDATRTPQEIAAEIWDSIKKFCAGYR